MPIAAPKFTGQGPADKTCWMLLLHAGLMHRFVNFGSLCYYHDLSVSHTEPVISTASDHI